MVRSKKDLNSSQTARRLAKLPLHVLRQRKSKLLEVLEFQKQAKIFSKVPVAIFATNLSPAEALVKWLKENHKVSITKIARILNRDPRSIWITYRNAQAKYPKLLLSSQKITVPLSIFKDRTLSILEHLVLHLKDEQGLKLTTISTLLRKHHNTISTVYQRGKRKHA